MAHKHKDVIIAWAKGAEIEGYDAPCDTWHLLHTPQWHSEAQYRVKPTKPKDKHMEALIVLSFHAGPLLYAAAPDEANCVLVFDGETNKLIKAEVKSPKNTI